MTGTIDYDASHTVNLGCAVGGNIYSAKAKGSKVKSMNADMGCNAVVEGPSNGMWSTAQCYRREDAIGKVHEFGANITIQC